jgi:hypothetical protein
MSRTSHYLCIGLSAFCGLASELLVVMWERSYRVEEMIAIPVANTNVCLMSEMGRIIVGAHPKVESRQKVITNPEQLDNDLRGSENDLGVRFAHNRNMTVVQIRYEHAVILLLLLRFLVRRVSPLG